MAIGAAALAAVLVSNAVVQDRAVADAIGRLPPEQRVVSVSWVGSSDAELRALDREARATLSELDVGEPVRAVAFRTTRVGSRNVRLAAFDRPDEVLEARTGKLPGRCAQASCEAAVLDARLTGLVGDFGVVGTATSRGGFPVEQLTGTPSASAPVLLVRGVEELGARPEVANLFRTHTWAVLLPRDLDASVAAALPVRIGRLDTRLRNRSGGFSIQAPLDDLARAAEHAERASRRQLLIAGACTALFLAFVVLAASRIRLRARATAFRLRRLGARRWQVALESLAFVALIAIPATLLGWAGGAAVGALVARAADESAREALRRSVLTAEGVLIFVAVAVVVVAALLGTIRASTLEVRGRRISAVDVATAGVLAVLATAIALRADNAAEDGTVLLALPVLIALAGGLLTARALAPLLRLVEPALGRSSTSVRLAALSLARNPGPVAVTVACLAITAALAVFAVSYDATLTANQRDAAAYAVPLDYVVARDDTRASGFGSRTELARAYGDGAFGVVREAGEAPSLNRREQLTVLGIDAQAVRELRWRDDFSGRSQGELAEALGRQAAGLRGPAIPPDAERLVLPRRLTGDPIRISASIRRPDGGFAAVDLPAGGARLPGAVRGGTLVALTLGFPPGEEFTAAHRATGRAQVPDVFLRGRVTLGRPFVTTPGGREQLAVDYRGWVQSDGSGGGGERSRLEIGYFLSQERAFRIRPRQRTDNRSIPVIASRSIAQALGGDGVLPIRLGPAELDVRVVATARRFPTLRGDFLVADRTALETAANASAPGSAVAEEAWLNGPPGLARELGRRAAIPVTVTSRRGIEDDLRADPVARSVSLALLATAGVAALLALLGLLLTVSLEARDNRAELFDLEALGLDPRGLARHLWLRSALVVGAGLVAGVVTGIAAAVLVSDVVVTTANATTAEPPIRTVLDWPLLAALLAAFVAVALLANAAVARSSFRGPAPERPS